MTKILIIEDDESEIFMLKTLLERLGYEVDSALNGEEGLLKAKAIHPDLITLDILLPGMNGLEALDRFKADTDTKAIPLVIISNLDDEKDIETALLKGAVRYIPKSQYDMNQIGDAIKQILSGTQ